jgi:hypothetical protein
MKWIRDIDGELVNVAAAFTAYVYPYGIRINGLPFEVRLVFYDDVRSCGLRVAKCFATKEESEAYLEGLLDLSTALAKRVVSAPAS